MKLKVMALLYIYLKALKESYLNSDIVYITSHFNYFIDYNKYGFYSFTLMP